MNTDINHYNNKLITKGLLLFLTFALLSCISILFVDKQLALLIHKIGLDEILSLRQITEYSPFILALTVLLFIFLSNESCCINNKFKDKLLLIIYIALLVIIAGAAKTLLKDIFGRYWIQSWKGDNLSLLRDSIYGFKFMGGFSSKENFSFPSGHLTFISTICISTLILYPKFKILAFIFIIGAVLAQVSLNYHYLGDTLCGIALGYLFAYLGISLYIKINESCKRKLIRLK